ncbi:MAG: SirB2 family protein [Gammaproteobacteria bacterium]|nr:SirB2 family protein [Gammaproteobacteria bacterium]
MTYYWIRQLHIATVVFTICFFALRFYWMLYHPGLVKKNSVRYLAQLNDTILLGAGISLAVMSHQYPFDAPWLTAKLIVLLVYIFLGVMALKVGKTRRARTVYGILALLSVGYIVTVALSRTPASWAFLGS